MTRTDRMRVAFRAMRQARLDVAATSAHVSRDERRLRVKDRYQRLYRRMLTEAELNLMQAG